MKCDGYFSGDYTQERRCISAEECSAGISGDYCVSCSAEGKLFESKPEVGKVLKCVSRCDSTYGGYIDDYCAACTGEFMMPGEIATDSEGYVNQRCVKKCPNEYNTYVQSDDSQKINICRDCDFAGGMALLQYPEESAPTMCVQECATRRVWKSETLSYCHTCAIFDGGESMSYPDLNNTAFKCLSACAAPNTLFTATISEVTVQYCKNCVDSVIVPNVTCLKTCPAGFGLRSG